MQAYKKIKDGNGELFHNGPKPYLVFQSVLKLNVLSYQRLCKQTFLEFLINLKIVKETGYGKK